MKVRIISAFVAIAILLPFIYFGGAIYAFLIGILAILGFKELVDLKKHHQVIPFIPTLVSMTGLLFIIYNHYINDIYGFFNIVLILLFIFLLTPTILYQNDSYKTIDAIYLYGVTVFLGMAFNSIILVRDIGLNVFFFLVFIAVVTDTAAMICGRYFGKNKMCPKISPRKTWEGALGGILLGSLIPLVYYHFVIESVNLEMFFATIILSGVGQIGDLIFSKIKRENEIKDFSNIMPGHGGILDRLDSVIFIFMTYVVLKLLFL